MKLDQPSTIVAKIVIRRLGWLVGRLAKVTVEEIIYIRENEGVAQKKFL